MAQKRRSSPRASPRGSSPKRAPAKPKPPTEEEAIDNFLTEVATLHISITISCCVWRQVALNPANLAGADRNTAVSQACQQATKALFDRAKKNEPRPFGVLPELLVEGFDAEQVWEQIQLRNVPMLRYIKKQTNKLLHNDEANTTQPARSPANDCRVRF